MHDGRGQFEPNERPDLGDSVFRTSVDALLVDIVQEGGNNDRLVPHDVSSSHTRSPVGRLVADKVLERNSEDLCGGERQN
jgi:hypothetical protein